MKKVEIVLVVCVVLLAGVIFTQKDGAIRKFFDDIIGTAAIAEPQDTSLPAAPTQKSTKSQAAPVPAAKPEESAGAADNSSQPVNTDAEAKPDESESSPETPVDPNGAGGLDSIDDDFLKSLAQSYSDVQFDPNYAGPSVASEAKQEEIVAVLDEDPMESINLNNVEMKNIVQTLGEWTKTPIIPTDDEIMTKRITIYATEKVPRSKALALIIDALKAKGVILEKNADRILLKPIATAKLGSIPTLPADEPLARITDKSQIVEKFFKLKNYSPTRLVSIISPLIADYGHVTAMEDTKSISIIDTVENLIRIERIITQLDVPESEQAVEQIFEITNGDPVEIVQVLQVILDTESRDRRSGGFNPSGSSGSSGSSSAARPSSANDIKPATSVVIQQGQVPIKLIPIPKHNWIIARGSVDDVKRIGEWIAKLDKIDAVQSEQTIIQLRYADAREVASIIEDTITQVPGTNLKTSVVVQALPQSRQIVIFGTADNRKMVEKLIAEIDLPTQDVYIEKTFKLKYADPDQIKENIDNLYGESSMNSRSSYGGLYGGYSSYNRGGRSGSGADDSVVKVVSYPTVNQVTVIASDKNMAKIEKQITEEWDVPLDIARDQYRIVTVDNSDPVQLSNLLTKLFSGETSNSQDLFRFIFGGRSDTQKKIVGSLYGMLTFEPVPDTKKIIVISKIPEAYDVIEKLIMQLDSQEKAEVPHVITLKYADPEDLCDQLNALLNEAGTQATLQRSSRGLSDVEADGTVSSSSAGTATNDAGTITPWWTRQRTNSTEAMPTSNLIGQVRFIPVARSKAILVLAPPEYLDDINKMVTELDQPGMQVMIKVVIAEVNHSSMTSLGVQLTTDSSMVNAFTDNAANILSGFVYNGNIGSTVLDMTANLNTLISLLVKKTNAKILNQPTLWTKDNEEAVFIKGQRVAFIQGDQDSANGITRSFSYDDVGLTLRLRPNITPEKAVDMTINLIISQVEPERINDQVAVSNLDTTTHLIVNDGQTIMLGGILFQNESNVKRKVPLLGDVPIMGELFKHSEKQLSNDELLCFVTPYVIDSDNLNAIPADKDTKKQLEEPLKKMQEIRGNLDKAMEWLSSEVKEENYDVKKDDKSGEVEIAVPDAASSDKTVVVPAP